MTAGEQLISLLNEVIDQRLKHIQDFLPIKEKKCGNCRFWSPFTAGQGLCVWKPLFPLPIAYALRSTKEEQGSDCPCWEEE